MLPRGYGFIGLLLLLTGCSTTGADLEQNYQQAQRLAATASLAPVRFNAPPFVLAGWMRTRQPNQPLVVYIEGDGRAWLDRQTPSTDPTPESPLALKLAVLDPSPNLLYLARPCQYVQNQNKKACSGSSYWTRKRFAPEVIESMSMAINQAKEQARAQTVDLVGFSGGGAVVVLVAAGRDDVSSIRTVAGNLDSANLHMHHKVTPLYGSMEPLNTAFYLADVPQIHYCGGQDRVVPPFVSQNYLKASGKSRCIQRQVIPTADHHNGWTEAWSSLVNTPPSCR